MPRKKTKAATARAANLTLRNLSPAHMAALDKFGARYGIGTRAGAIAEMIVRHDQLVKAHSELETSAMAARELLQQVVRTGEAFERAVKSEADAVAEARKYVAKNPLPLHQLRIPD